jgi:hypothetical protein
MEEKKNLIKMEPKIKEHDPGGEHKIEFRKKHKKRK